jgi:hypothetical protein
MKETGMDKHLLVTDEAQPLGAQPGTTCTCASPIPEVRATWKGAARTHCSRCDLPVQLDFATR